jgi:hypothetical protein
MRMRSIARSYFAMVVIVAIGGSPVVAARSRRPLGVVVQADRGHIDTTSAVTGADIYSCDSLDTDDGGKLRVKVGSSQVFLSALSTAALEDDGSAIQVLATSGTVGFAFSAAPDLSVRTPAGIIRGESGQAASGKVAYTGSRELIISAIHGDLVLDNGGELRTISEGKSADVTFEENVDNTCHDESAANHITQRGYTQHKIGFVLIASGTMAIPGYFLWRYATESNSQPVK